MRESGHSKHVPLSDWEDPDPTWQRAWRHRRRLLLTGSALVVAAVVLAAVDPLVPPSLAPVWIACVIVGVLTSVGLWVGRVVRWRFRDTRLMSASWRTDQGPLLLVVLVVALVVLAIVALIVRIATGDPTLTGHDATIGLFRSISLAG